MKPKTVLITGGAGFIGSNFIPYFLAQHQSTKIINLDKLTYAGELSNLEDIENNESYFFAEVKRLKEIMNKADEAVSFVLLDEILRGTNSDDKRTGTVEVIKKIIGKKVIGAIATHDLKVCDTTQEYPETLINIENCIHGTAMFNSNTFGQASRARCENDIGQMIVSNITRFCRQ